jgi:amino acid transporter
MTDNTSQQKSLGDTEHLSVLGFEGTYERSMSLWGNLALGFTYLSPLVAIYAYFAFALSVGGPPSVFWILIVGAGQLLVALVMGEVVSQYPIAGGIYPWARRLWGKRYAWMAAWVYIWAMIVTITAVAEYGSGFLANLLGIPLDENGYLPMGWTLGLSVALLLIALLFNLGGTRMTSRIARIGLAAELIGVVGLGLYLLIFDRKNDFSVFFDSFGKGDGNYMGAFVGAALIGLFMFYGFEACGDVAEEVTDAARRVPRAMYLTIFVGGVSALMSFVGYVLAAPNLASIVSGEDPNPIPSILESALGPIGAKIFLVIACMAFISCVLSLQAAASRLLHSFARDGMLPASAWLAKLSPRTQVPTRALIVASVIPMLICVVVFVLPDALVQVTSFAVLGIYVAFQAIVLAALRQRFKGWKPAGPFNLGAWGMIINIGALVYGIIAIILLLLGPGFDIGANYITWIGLVVVVIIGALYLFIARPDRKSTSPEGDAIEVANKIRAHIG